MSKPDNQPSSPIEALLMQQEMETLLAMRSSLREALKTKEVEVAQVEEALQRKRTTGRAAEENTG